MKRTLIFAAALAAASVNVLAGDVLTASNGRTVYTFDKDAGGKSTCYDACAALWPAVPANGVSGAEFAAVDRNDGSKQAAFKGQPIYFYAADTQPGDMKGEGIKGVWHVIATGKQSQPKAPSGTSTGY